MKLVFITDLHFKAQSGVRTGDYLSDLLLKLQWVADFTNSHDALCVIGGDIFDASTVSDAVKYQVISVFKKFKRTPYAIWGNHDMRYGGDSFNNMTSLGTLFVSGVLHEFEYEDFGSFVLTGGRYPVTTAGKPQIAVRHALLNMKDSWSLNFEEITTLDKCIILLGHDHMDYGDALEYSSNVKIYRPGSFARCRRVDDDLRTPRLLYIDTDTFSVESVNIACARNCNEIFQLSSGLVDMESHDVGTSYDDLIEKISGASSKTMSFDDCLQSVGTPDVVDLIHRIELESSK